MRWLTAVEDMNTPALKHELRRQRISFCFALFNVVTFSAWANVRSYLAFIGDRYMDRVFFGRTLLLFPVWGMCWIIGFFIVVISVARYRRITWYGFAALAADAVPFIVMAYVIVRSFSEFAANQ